MSSETVKIITCDRCGLRENIAPDTTLPDGWGHLQVSGDLTGKDLCPSCVAAVMADT